MFSRRIICGLPIQLICFLWIACLAGYSAEQAASTKVLAKDAMRLLHANCLSCHNPEKHKGGLQMTSRELLLKGSDSGPVLQQDKIDESLLVKVLAADSDPHMPPKKQLSTNQIALFRTWISAGAPWDVEALAKVSAPRIVKFEPMASSYHPVMALALSPDAKRLAVGRANELIVYDLVSTNFPVLHKTKAHADVVRSLAWSPDGKWLASGAFRELTLWDAETLSLKRNVSTNLIGRVDSLRFTPHGGALVAADGETAENGWVRVFSIQTGAEISAWQTDSDTLYDVAISPDGGLLATASGDKLVKLWEIVSQKEIGQIEAHLGAIWGAAFNTNATELVTVGSDKQLKIWDVKSRESVVTIGGRKHNFINVAWSGDGKTVVAADDEGRLIRFTNFKRHTGEQSSETAQEHQLGSWSEPLHAISISEDASRIAAGGQDGIVYLVDYEGKLLQEFITSGEAPEGTAEAAVLPKSQLTRLVPSFVHDVLPQMAKAGCMAGSCHAKPEGQNGFKLSVFSFDPKADYAEIVKEARGRRIFPAAPEESLVLLKPTMAIDHGGGQRFEPGSETYKIMLDWIRGGMVYQQPHEPTLARIQVEPSQGSYKKNTTQQLKVSAFYSDGSECDVTHLVDFVSNDKEIAKVDTMGAVQIGNIEGEGVIVARFMGFVDASRITVPATQLLPEERYAALPVNNYIDRLAYAQFRRLGLYPSDGCTDSDFIRRSSLDAIGTLPRPEEVRRFLADPDPGKRRRWIEHLLEHPAYADYWANKWTDLIRPNPDRVGVKSIYFLDQWVRESFRANKPYDQFVREIITGEGSNHADGPMTIYRDRREPPELTTMFSELFLGVRIECAKCHHHPNEKWSQEDFYSLAAYFGPIKQKGAGLSPPISAGRESFYFASGGAVRHPVTDAVMKPRPLDAETSKVPEGVDPRRALADWMTDPKNPFFAKAAVNRVWGVFFGRGIVEPVDDFRISNPASNEPLLDTLARDFVQHGYDLKHVMRTIMESHLYQLSSLPNDYNLADTKNFSRSYRRRLPAEVLLDAMNDIAATEDDYNGCPPGTRAIQTWSYKVRSHFMDAFGRPNSSSDCPCERDFRSSVVQALHMMNARELQAKLSSKEGRVRALAEGKLTEQEIVTDLYITSLCRFPKAEEIDIAIAAFNAPKATRQSATEDVLWALLNSPEFVLNH
ncbi:MAG TPA: DUF1549 domain-containing protein [Verrucomicrobiae bacterium]|nr:DUF1549 domain-containing protein [Verrucomicrobiae bacterium]